MGKSPAQGPKTPGLRGPVFNPWIFLTGIHLSKDRKLLSPSLTKKKNISYPRFLYVFLVLGSYLV